MRLFYQLESSEQDDIIDHCVTIVLEDIIDNGLTLEAENEADMDLKDKMDDAKMHIATMVTTNEKMDYLMCDADIADTVFEIATEMAKNAFYHEPGEMVFFPDALSHKCEHDHVDDEPLLLPAATVSKKDLN